MSEQVERRVLELLGNPTESPYGNPIPGLAELGVPAAPAFMDGVVNLVSAVSNPAATAPISVVIRRLGEPVQFEPELLQQLQNAGVMPGATVTASAAGSYVFVAVEGFGDGLELPNEVAVHIFVGV